MANSIGQTLIKDAVSFGVTALAIKLFVTSVNPVSAVAFLVLSELPSILGRYVRPLADRMARHKDFYSIATPIISLLAVQRFLDPTFVVASALKTVLTQVVSYLVLHGLGIFDDVQDLQEDHHDVPQEELNIPVAIVQPVVVEAAAENAPQQPEDGAAHPNSDPAAQPGM